MDHYQQLAEVALAQCPPSFRRVRLQAELDDGYAEIDLRCMSESEEKQITDYPDLAGVEMHEALDAIREEMGRLSGQRWSKCVFQVFPDGTFKFDVEY